VAMGTLADTAIAVVDHLRARGRRAGALALTAFRPFPAAALADALAGARAIATLARRDEPTAADNPLTRELKAALFDRLGGGGAAPAVLSVSAGLRSPRGPRAAPGGGPRRPGG